MANNNAPRPQDRTGPPPGTEAGRFTPPLAPPLKPNGAPPAARRPVRRAFPTSLPEMPEPPTELVEAARARMKAAAIGGVDGVAAALAVFPNGAVRERWKEALRAAAHPELADWLSVGGRLAVPFARAFDDALGVGAGRRLAVSWTIWIRETSEALAPWRRALREIFAAERAAAEMAVARMTSGTRPPPAPRAATWAPPITIPRPAAGAPPLPASPRRAA